MKFRFCGDLDCPDWLLAEISTLSKLTSVRMKQLCSEVVKDLLDGEINYEQIIKWTSAKYEDSDVKAAISALSYIISSAAKFSVDGESLDNELQQLGLPKENASSLCRVYADNLTNLQTALKSKSLRVSKLESVDWRVDYILSSSKLKNVEEAFVQLKFDLSDGKTIGFSVSSEKFRLLLKDLRQAQKIMNNLK